MIFKIIILNAPALLLSISFSLCSWMHYQESVMTSVAIGNSPYTAMDTSWVQWAYFTCSDSSVTISPHPYALCSIHPSSLRNNCIRIDSYQSAFPVKFSVFWYSFTLVATIIIYINTKININFFIEANQCVQSWSNCDLQLP